MSIGGAALQPDGKVVVAGNYWLEGGLPFVARLDATGALDPALVPVESASRAAAQNRTTRPCSFCRLAKSWRRSRTGPVIGWTGSQPTDGISAI